MSDPVRLHREHGDQDEAIIDIASPLSLATGRSKEGVLTICAATEDVKRRIVDLLGQVADSSSYDVRIVRPIPALMKEEEPIE